jgi:periplasmic copper chaperone A
MHRIPRAELCAALLVTLSASAALAHASLERKVASPNSSYRGVVQITHGCDGQPTTRVRVTIPEGMVGAKPMPKPGWQIATARGAYGKPYQSFHGTVSEGVTSITWSGGALPDDQIDEFTFFARVSDAFAPGSIVYFPVEQDCSTGQYRWSETPAAGQSAKDLRSPAPGVLIVAAEKSAAAPASPAVTKAGDLAIATPWMRATPGGAKVAGGYVRITNTGTTPDTLIAASIPQAARGEIHAMSMEGGVMRMAPVEGGLTIKPGETVELKPGGLHLMFQDLTSGPKAGESVQGSLTFARAGTVPVTFSVAPIGAQAPDGEAAGGHHHH